MHSKGFIKLDRNILNWRWYKNANTLKLFMHLLIIANYSDAEFENQVVKRGQLITGRKKLSEDTGLSEQEVRTALNHLISTKEITIKSSKKYSLITINNYDYFQDATNALVSQSTNNQPTTNQQLTNNQPQYKNNNKEKNNKNNKNNKNCENNNYYYFNKYLDYLNSKEYYLKHRHASYTLEDFENHSLFND